MNGQHLERIMSAPDLATPHDVTWLCRELVQLRADYADEKARCFKVEMELDECRERLAGYQQMAASRVGKVPR